MAQLVVAAAGAAVGFMVGGPMGAKIGWVAGTMIGSAFAPAQKSQGPRLDDLKVSTSSYGTPIPYVAGHPRVSGQIVWASTKREISTTQEAGKGGGGSEYTSYTYEVDLLILLSDNVIPGVARVWANGELVFDGEVKDNLWSRMTAYTGAASQLPDPDYEAVVGTANAPAYRGRGSVFIKSLQLGGSGQIPNLTFEIGRVTADDVSWAVGSIPSGFWQDVASNGTLYCAVGDSGVVATSLDGVTWTLGGSLINQLVGITWGGGQFCVVGNYSTAKLSPDGVTWTPRTMPSGAWFAVEWNDFLFCAVGSSVCATSPDGITWTSRSIPSGDWRAIAWNGSLFCAVGYYSDAATSPDGATWTQQAIPGTSIWRGVVWNGLLFCAVGSNVCATSPDGVNWTSQTIPTGDWHDVAWDGSLFCAVSPTGSVISTDGVTWTASAIQSGSWWGVTTKDSEFCAVGGSGACAVGVWAATVAVNDLTILDVASDVCLLSGISAGQFDASALSTITRPVRAMAISQVSSARTVLEMLAAAYHFDCVLSDKLYFRPRASASVATLTFDEFGVAVDSNSDADPLPLMMANELEIPAQLAVTYSNVDGDYQTDTQYSDRLLTGQESTSATSLPLGFTASEAKQIADAMLLDKAVSALSTVVSVDITRAELEPTDVVTLTGDDGFSYRMRIIKKTEAAGVITLGCVADDVAAFTQAGVTDGGTASQTEVLPTPTTLLELLDIPLLRDADNLPGHYVAVKGSAANWSNCALFESADNVTYTQTTTISGAAVMGDCTATLGAWTGGNFADESNTLTVDVGAGQLSSVTHEQMLSNHATNAALVGDEIIQFRDATLVGAGVYTLRGLLRGKRGTEWATGTHAASERFVLLGTSGLRFIPQQTSDIGLLAYYKAINTGQTLSAVTAQSMTLAANVLKPLAPVNVRVSDGSLISWDRRSRLSENWLTGVTPLGESTESYDVEVFNSSDVMTESTTVSVPYFSSGEAVVSTGFAAGTGIHFMEKIGSDYFGVTAKSQTNTTTALHRLSTAGASLESSVTLGYHARSVAYAGNVVYVATDEVTSNLISGSKIHRLTTSPIAVATTIVARADGPEVTSIAHDGTYLWAAYVEVSAIVKLDGTSLATIASTAIPRPHYIHYSGGYLYIICRMSSLLIKWDCATNTEVWRLTTPSSPMEVFKSNDILIVTSSATVSIYLASNGDFLTSSNALLIPQDPSYARTIYAYNSQVAILCNSIYSIDMTVQPLRGVVAFLNAITGVVENMLDVPLLTNKFGGVDGDIIVLSLTNTSADYDFSTNGIGSGLPAGGSVNVYQKSALVGRGVVASITL